MTEQVFGFELILNLHDCNTDRFNTKDLKEYFKGLCNVIGTRVLQPYFWDASESPHGLPKNLHGISAVCFILTSSITIHTANYLKTVYINIFSCKDFNSQMAEDFTMDFFEADDYTRSFHVR